MPTLKIQRKPKPPKKKVPKEPKESKKSNAIMVVAKLNII